MRRPLRIAMLAHSTNPRGGVVHALALSEALTALGHDVVLHAPDAKGHGFFRAARCEMRPFPVAPAAPDTHAMIEQRVADYVEHFSESRNRGFDVYHAQDGISGNALATLKAQGLITGYVRTVHHVDAFADPRIASLQTRSIREADAWMTVSGLWRDRLRDDFGVDAIVCGNGVDCVRFHAGLDGREPELRLSLGLSPGPLFLAIGGVEERKNTLRILEAFAQLVAVRPDAELVIAGGASLLDHSDYQQAFAARLARMGPAAASVHRPGVIKDADMPRLYRLATALVFASVKEGFGLCVLEAMASGVPAIASAIEPFLSYLEPDEAIWCDPMSPATIADAMALTLSEESARPFRKRGPSVAARFDWRSVAQAHEPQYRRLLEVADA
jgi:glycosyltransferase-like protein